MAEPKARTCLTPTEAAAAVALTAAQIDGTVINAKSFRRRSGVTTFRVEVEVTAGRVEGLLSALEAPDAEDV